MFVKNYLNLSYTSKSQTNFYVSGRTLAPLLKYGQKDLVISTHYSTIPICLVQELIYGSDAL